MRAEVGPVSKNLMAVADLCDSGHRVIFDNIDGHYAQHRKTGHILRFERVGKIFNFGVDVKAYTSQAGFTRRG